jgi:hypothetical protein
MKTAQRDAYTIKTTCAHCGEVIQYQWTNRVQECDDCAEWFNSTSGEDFHEPDYGGAFDGFTVTSDADPGL